MKKTYVFFFIPGTCRRFAGSAKGYVDVTCPAMVLDYNKAMGGVDLVNQCIKCYRIHTRIRKWYWALYTWFLNAQMVQAWRLFRFTMKLRNQALEEEEDEEDEDEIQFEKRIDGLNALQKLAKRKERKEREELKKKKKRQEKKKEEMPLLDFVREVVEITLDRHSEVNRNIPARLGAPRLSSTSQEAVRLDMSRPHLIVRSTITGRCKLCSKRSFYRGVDLSPKF